MAFMRMAFLLLSTGMAVCQAQAPPAGVDMRDPAAVVAAYVQACEKPDVGAALALVAMEPAKLLRLRKGLEQMAEGVRHEQPEGGFMTMVTELTLLPLGVSARARTEKQPDEAGLAVVTVTPQDPPRRQFVLARSADGTWRIDLEKSICRTTGRARSWFVGQVTGGPGAGGGQGRQPWAERERTRRLVQALTSYAEAHNNRLPAAGTWMDDLEAYCLDRSLVKPAEGEDAKTGWVLNSQAAGQPVPRDWSLRRSLVLIFAGKGAARNASGDVDRALEAAVDMNETLLVGLASGEVTAILPGMTVAALAKAYDDNDTCQQRVRVLCQALLGYARASGGLLPPADAWCDKIGPYLEPEQASPRTFTCPSRPDMKYAWAINKALAGTDIRKLEGHERYVLLLPAAEGMRNEARDLPATVTEGVHLQPWNDQGRRTVTVGMLDGNARSVAEGEPYPQPGKPE